MNEIYYTTVEAFYSNDKDKQGKLFTDSKNRNFKKVAIKIPEYKDQGLSCLCYPPREGMRPREELSMAKGEMYGIKVEHNGEYTNFKLASKLDQLEKRMEDVEKEVYKKPSKPLITKKDEQTVEDQPFESDFVEHADYDMSQIPF